MNCITKLILTCALFLSSLTLASARELDDVTIQVIGLDELPNSSIEVINLPEAQIGEILELNEGLIPNTVQAPIFHGSDNSLSDSATTEISEIKNDNPVPTPNQNFSPLQ